jgi:hypothetical protein
MPISIKTQKRASACIQHQDAQVSHPSPSTSKITSKPQQYDQYQNLKASQSPKSTSSAGSEPSL